MKHVFTLTLLLLMVAVISSAISIENPYTRDNGTQSVRLYKGWNLVYGFMYAKQVENLWDTGHIKAIYAFVPNIQKIASFYPGVDTNIYSLDDDTLGHTAFWVYVDENWVGNYWLLEEVTPFEERPLYPGWNLFAITPDMLNAILSRGSCNIEKMAGWDSPSQKWSVVTEDVMEDYGMSWERFNLADNPGDIGVGIAIKVTNNCKLARSVQSPPSLP